MSECMVCLREIQKNVKCLHCDKLVCSMCAERHSTEMRRDVEQLLGHVKGKHQAMKTSPTTHTVDEIKRRTKELKFRHAEITNSIILALDKNLSQLEHQLDGLLRAEVGRTVKRCQNLNDMDMAIKASSSVLEKTSEHPLPQEEMIAIQKLLLGCVSGVKANESLDLDEIETKLVDIVSLENLRLLEKSLNTNSFVRVANVVNNNNKQMESLENKCVNSGSNICDKVLDSNLTESLKNNKEEKKPEKFTMPEKVQTAEQVRVFFDFTDSSRHEDNVHNNEDVGTDDSSNTPTRLPHGMLPPPQVQTMSAKKVYVQLQRPYGMIHSPQGDLIITDEGVYGDGTRLASGVHPRVCIPPPHPAYIHPGTQLPMMPGMCAPGYQQPGMYPYGMYPSMPPYIPDGGFVPPVPQDMVRPPLGMNGPPQGIVGNPQEAGRLPPEIAVPPPGMVMQPHEVAEPMHDNVTIDDQYHRISEEDQPSGPVSSPPVIHEQIIDENLPSEVQSADISKEDLNTLPAEERSQFLGNHLFPKVQEIQPDLAAKITGMFLELEQSEILQMLNSKERLKKLVDEAVEVLKGIESKDT